MWASPPALHPLKGRRGRRWPDELDYRAPGHYVVLILVVPLDAEIRPQELVRDLSVFAAHEPDGCHGVIVLILGVLDPTPTASPIPPPRPGAPWP